MFILVTFRAIYGIRKLKYKTKILCQLAEYMYIESKYAFKFVTKI